VGYLLKRFKEVTMKKYSNFNIIFLLFLFVLPLFISGCGDQEYKSYWLKGDIKIDGNQEDWGNRITFFKDENVGIGIQNDSDNVYVCLVTSDRGHIMSTLRNGFTLWIDPQNDNRVYGIKFPIGMSNDMMFNYEEKQNGNYQDISSMMKKYESSMNEFELVKQDGELLSGIPVKNDYGIQMKIKISRDQLVYELKLPLSHSINNGFFVNAAPGKEIRLGFEEGKIDRSKKRTGLRGNEGQVGGGDDGTREGEMRGGGRMGRVNFDRGTLPHMSDPLNIWFKVSLGEKPENLK
jgi:hypothetical protein